MVDPVGATLGVLGVAGLFTVCVDCFDYIKASRSVGKSFAIRETQLDALRMRLFAWGHTVRLTDRAGYDVRLDDPRWKNHVQKQLNVISLLFIDAKKIIKRYDLEERYEYHAQGPTGANAAFLEENFRDFLQRAKKTQKKAGLFNSMRYSLSSQKDFKDLLENLEKAVGQLEWVLQNLDLFEERNKFIQAFPTKEEDNLTNELSVLALQERKTDEPAVEHLVATTPLDDSVPGWLVPVGRNSKFSGREDDLVKLEGLLFSNNEFSKAAVYGLGGIGKTQVALELAYRTRDKIPDCSIFWIPALTADTFRGAYMEIARQLKIPGKGAPDCAPEECVKAYLSSQYRRSWLLIIDNADDTDVWLKRAARAKGDVSKCLINYLPQSSKGSIVLTTRNRSIANDFAGMPGATIEVQKMDEDIAIELFCKSVRSESMATDAENLRVLLEELTYLPLAISQAVAYINETGTPISDYMDIIRGQEADKIELLSKDFEDEGRYDSDLDPSGKRNAIAKTWLVSFEQVRRQNQLATDYLAFMSFVEPKDMPLSLLPAAKSRTEFQDAVGILDGYGFVTRRTGSQALDMHRLIRLATRNWLRERKQFRLCWIKALIWMGKTFPNGSKDEDRPLWRSYMAHANRLLEETVEIGEDEGARAVRSGKITLLWSVAVCLNLEGRIAESIEKYTEALDESRRIYGERDRQTLMLMRAVAMGMVDQARSAEAEKLWRHILQLCSDEFGEKDAESIQTMGRLGICLSEQGQHSEARDLLRKALQMSGVGGVGGVGGDDGSEMNLAQTWQTDVVDALAGIALQDGSLDEAERLQRQTVAFYRSSPRFGSDHTYTMMTESTLVFTLIQQGRVGMAEELLIPLLNKQRRLLGAEHPDTLDSTRRLAIVKSAQGLWAESEVLERDVISCYRKTRHDPLGLLAALNNLALSVHAQGPSRINEAVSLMKECVAGREQLLGEDHYVTVAARNLLARFLENRDSQGSQLAPSS
jgi:tetratricopeptide (TPR) repeat protein